MALTYQQAVEQTITGAEQFHEIINGSATSEVVVEDGSKIPTVRKALLDNFYYKDPINWQQGQNELVFNQIRKFTDGTWWIAPTATATNPVVMGVTPYGDPLWKVFSWDRVIDSQKANRKLIERSWAEAGYNVVAGSFQEGATLNTTTDVIINYGSDFGVYSWGGTLPKVVPANSTVTGTGGVSLSSWIDVSYALLKLNLSNGDDISLGDSMIAVKQPAEGAANITQHDMNLLNINLSQFEGGTPSTPDICPALSNAITWLSTLGGGVLNITKPGTYKMLSEIVIPSNITLNSVQGVIFKRMYAGGVMFRLSESTRDISIIGGTFDSNGQDYPNDAAVIFAAYNVNKLTFSGSTFLDVVDFHAIDLSRASDILVRGCKFLGFKNTGSRNFSEAIQLDPGFISSGGTYYPNKRITVSDCYFGPNEDNPNVDFTSWGAGVGNHADALGNQSEDIIVKNSTFIGCIFGGVRVFNWNGYLIEGNTFRDSTSRGVHITPVPDAIAPQGTKHGRIVGNAFIGVRTPVLVAAPTWPFTDITNAFHQHLIISNNTATLTENTSVAFDISWVDGLALTGNNVRGGIGLASFNFVRNAQITGNTGSDFTSTGIWFKEITATTFIGSGLSSGVVVSGNVIRNVGLHGIHINCALNGANIISNLLIGTSTVGGTSNGIRADSSAKNIVIGGNNHLDGGGVNKPQIGISITSSCETIHVINNKAFGTISPQNNQGINGSSLVMVGGIGAPSSSGVAAPPGSMYLRYDGGNGTSQYIKESATNATGWVGK